MAALAVVFAIAAVIAHSVVSAAVAAADDASSTAARNFTIASPPSPTTSGPVTYVFGDSMSDVGNNNYFPMSREVQLPLVRHRLPQPRGHREVHQWKDHRRLHG